MWPSTPSTRRWLTAWQKQARAIGYDSAAHVLDAADFGNPTMRRRTFVFAWPVGASWGEALRVRPEGNFARPGSASVARGDKLPWMPMLDRLTSGCCAGWGLVDCVNLGGLDVACRGCGTGRKFAPAPNTQGEHGRRGGKGVVIETLRGPKPWHLWIRDTVGDKQPRFDKFVPADMAGAWTKIDADARSLALRAGQRVSEYLSRTVVPGFENKAEGLLIPPGVEPEEYGKTRDWQQKNLEQLQRMSVRDAAKLQDIPQWYGFEGTRADADADA
jgi:site-specific DNA-cytosine methylase